MSELQFGDNNGWSFDSFILFQFFLYQIQDKDLCRAISERTGESLEEVHKLSLQEKRELAQALGLEQVPP